VFCGKDFERLATQLRGLTGRFILTVNDRPELRSLFDWASIETAELSYSVGSVNGTAAREIIISGGGG